MSFGQVLVQLDRLHRSGLGLAECLLRFHSKKISQLDETFRQASIGCRVVGIGLDRFPKIPYGFSLSISGQDAREISALEVKRISFETNRARNGEWRFFVLARLSAYHRGDVACDLTLHPPDGRNQAIEGFAPQMMVGHGVTQLGRAPQPTSHHPS